MTLLASRRPLALVLACFSVVLGSRFPIAVGQEKGTNVSSAGATKEGTSKSDDKPEPPSFVRVTKDESGRPVALETSISPYVLKMGDRKTQVDLIGAVHVGEASYYATLNDKFKDYDAVLFELVAPEGTKIRPEDAGASRSPISALQVGMKEMLELEFQLEKIDYQKDNFIHADMTPGEMADSMTKQNESLWKMMLMAMGQGMAQQSNGNGASDAELLAALFSNNRALALKRAMADQMKSVDTQLAFLGKDSTLIVQRNKKAFQVLKREMAYGKKKIAVFYGAGHLPDMHERLVNEFKMERDAENETWLTAWDLRSDKQKQGK